MRLVISAVALLSLLPCADALAGGVQVESYLTTAQVVARSPVIFRAEVLKVAPVTRTVVLAGRKHKLVVERRLLVRVGEPLRGAEAASRLAKARKGSWLALPGDPRPDQWVVERDAYVSSYPLPRANQGDQIVVYLPEVPASGAGDKAHPLTARYLDRAAVIPRIRRLLPAAREAQKAAWREGARCQGDTWLFEDACLSLDAIASRLACPPGARPRRQLVHDLPSLDCVFTDGVGLGPAISWHRTGYPHMSGTLVSGRREGPWTTWDEQGHKRQESQYRQGRLDGPHLVLHPNGKPSVQGQHVEGLQDGTWKRLSAEGKALGTFALRRGTGLVVDWYEDGAKKSEVELRAGVRAGSARYWYENGSLRLEGRNLLGLRTGLWVTHRPDGTPERASCYVKGEAQWRMDDVAAARQRRCPAER